MIAYVRRKYGEGSVAQIATFGTLAARAAVKDVGRVLGFSIEQVTQLTKTIPERLNVTLDDALAESGDLRSLYETDPAVRELIDIARRLEGTNRNAGTHAAGVVIANGPLTDYVPLQRVIRKGDDAGARRDEAVVTTQWVMGDLEQVGMLKMDFLGLRTLTMLENAVRLIRKTRGETIDIYKLPVDDPETFALLQRGDAKGVFQFESDGIRELLKRIRPDGIRDLIACLALYRPGPLGGGMVDAYINCKHGRERPVYAHPVMAEVLSETYGVMVYQEQVMRILNRLGGIELSSAYACIKAISKKKQDVIDQRRLDFLRGARERGVSEATADDIFAKIVYFGGYGFNKSHTCAYAYLSYQTAYLKAHYPAEFMAALLSSEVDDGNKRDVLVEHIADARRLGVDVLPPDVNASDTDFTVRGGKVVFGLVAIKGVGRGAAAEVERARGAGGPFKDLFDFCERVDPKTVTKAALEKLAKAGAFDSLGVHRALALHVLPRALQAASDRQNDRRVGQGHLFDGFAAENGPEATAEALPEVTEWPESEKLRNEKEVLDFYFSSHPLAQREKELRRFATHTVEQLRSLPPDEEVIIGGMLTQLRFGNTKKARNGNSRYLRCKLEDFSGTAECVMWPDDFARHKEVVSEETPCVVKGTVERTREEPGLVLTRVLSVEQATRELATKLWLRFSLAEHGPRHVDLVAELLRRAPGRCPVFLAVRDGRGKTCVLRLGRDLAVNPASVPCDDLEAVLGRDGVRLE